MSFQELARRADYPPGRELVVRELCQAFFATGNVESLRLATLAATATARSLAPRVDDDRRARMTALDAGCVADELVRMARVARAGVGRG
ncbi:MAG: hypothetical protein ACRDGT_12470 [Candidatus Limnocylindria bacterium]